MNHEQLVNRAIGGDVRAFVDLTRRFQQFAFGTALAQVRDFQQAEDIVQEAFITAGRRFRPSPSRRRSPAGSAASSGITHSGCCGANSCDPFRSQKPKAYRAKSSRPITSSSSAARLRSARGYFAASRAATRTRDIVLRARMLASGHRRLPRAGGDDRQQSPARGPLGAQREDPDHGDRYLHAHALPDDFANRIGRLIEARGDMVEALFDPAALPDLMTELTVSDEARKRAVTFQVMQRPGGGIVRGIATSPVEDLPRGATVLNAPPPIEGADQSDTARPASAAASPRRPKTGYPTRSSRPASR